MSKRILTICLIYLTSLCMAQTPMHQWVTPFGSIGEEYAFSIALDDSSNSYVTGYIDASNFIRTNTNCINHDIFIAKYDKSGNQIWIKQMGGSGDDIGWGITVDKNYNVYVASSFMDTINLMTDTLISNGYVDMLISKFNSAGELQWARSAGGNGADYGFGIANDSQNNIYITGSFNGTSQFNTTTLTSNGWSDYYLAKYDTNGNLQWVSNNGGSTSIGDEGYSVSVDNNNNIYTCGKFSDTAYFTMDTLISKGGSDIFIAKYNSSGIMQWVKEAGGTDTDIAQGITQDNNGNSYVTGHFENTANFESTTLVSSGSSDIFVARFDSSGNLNWVRKAGGTGPDQGASISVYKNNNIYVSGFYYGNSTFGPYTITSEGLTDIFVLSADSAGNYDWIKHSGSSGSDAGSSLKTDSLNNIFIAGVFNTTCSFDNITVTSEGSKDLFVTKLGSNPPIGINENLKKENALLIYPNPANEWFIIKANDKTSFISAKVSIYNLMGELVSEKEIINESTIFDVRSLTKGSYIIRTKVNDNIFINRLVID